MNALHCIAIPATNVLWSATGTAPDGGVYTDFLARVNGSDPVSGQCVASTCTGLGGHTDWRIPTTAELQRALLAPFPFCLSTPCIDSIFGAIAPSNYCSATTDAANPTETWVVGFDVGFVGFFTKTGINFSVRAVRGGS